MQLTPTALEAMFQSYNFAFEGAYREQMTFYKEISTEVPSGTEREIYPFLQMIPTLREWLGERYMNNLSASDYSLTNKNWELTVEVDRNKIEDDTYGVYTPAMAMMGQQFKEWPDRELARVLEAGNSSLCWDGQYFFDTDHPVDPDNTSASTQSNNLIASSYALNVSDPTVPYQVARAAMAAWKRPDGLRMGNIPDTIMVPTDLEKWALQIQSGLYLPATIQNVAGTQNVAAASVTNIYAGGLRVIVNPFLTSASTWYLLCTKKVIKPLLWQNRKAAVLTPLVSPSDPNVFFQRKFVYGGDIRGAAGYTFPFLAFRMAVS